MDPEEIRLVAPPNSLVADLQCGAAAYERIRNAIREAAPACRGEWDGFRVLRIVDVSATEPQRPPSKLDWLIGPGCFLALLAIAATFIAGLLSVAELVWEVLQSTLA